jgi:hypothetical protein
MQLTGPAFWLSRRRKEEEKGSRRKGSGAFYG